jgi:hypothetical protein
MIVRILGEGQFNLKSTHLDKLNELDNKIVLAVANGNEKEFRRLFDQLLGLVRRQGQPLPLGDLRPSDIILPRQDLTFQEAKGLFAGEGLVPG